MHRCNDDVFPCRAAVHTRSDGHHGCSQTRPLHGSKAQRIHLGRNTGSRLGVAGGVDRADSLIVWTAWCMHASMWNLQRNPRYAIQSVPSTAVSRDKRHSHHCGPSAEPRCRNITVRLLSERVSSPALSDTSKTKLRRMAMTLLDQRTLIQYRAVS